MNIAQIEEEARREGPFSVKVAQGDRLDVPRPDFLILPPRESARRTSAVVHNDEGIAPVLPFLTRKSLQLEA